MTSLPELLRSGRISALMWTTREITRDKTRWSNMTNIRTEKLVSWAQLSEKQSLWVGQALKLTDRHTSIEKLINLLSQETN